jgi:DNA-binding beta-propeller fold protein YncE
LKFVQDIELSEKAARLDYQAYDDETNRLFITHLGDDKLIAVDLTKGRVLKSIRNMAKPHGVILVKREHRLYVSSTGTQEVVAVDTKTLEIVRRTAAGVYPDGLAYEPKGRKIYVTDEHGSQDVVIDAQKVAHLADLPVGGNHVGNTQYEPHSKLVWVAVGDINRLVGIEPSTYKIVRSIELSGTDGAHGLQFNEDGSLAFVRCEGDNKLAVVDMAAGKVFQTFVVAQTPDVLSFDRQLKTLYVACEGGALSIFHETSRRLEHVADQSVGPDAHTVCVDQKSHHVFFPLMNVNGKPVLRIMTPNRATK